MANLPEILSLIFFASGAFFLLVGSLGMLRFPDFYTRLHAAGITDTLGAELFILAMIFQAGGDWQVIVKLIFVALFLMFTSPVSTHAIAHAAWVGGLNPLLGKDLKHVAIAPNEAPSKEGAL